ncbi:MAG TPA: YbaB/EbfC family nucleoid-associated protein [Firmicutes bacterium]|nr:YbaB/EbfC family nucleoid-associated protein [Bacillota bacterium]
MKLPFLPDMDKMRDQLEKEEFKGVSSDGLVSATATAAQSLIGINIEKSLIAQDKADQLRKSVIEAVNNALDNSKQGVLGRLAEMFGGQPSQIMMDLFGRKD